MAEITTIARPYAKAVFHYALENNALVQWSETLAFSALVAEDEVMKALLLKPQLTAEQKASMFISVAEDKLDTAGKNLIKQLAANKRLNALPAIFVLYSELLAEQEKSVDVDVVSAFPMSDIETDKLVASLKTKLGRDVKLESTVDQSLIGGVIIHAGDLVIDDSVRGKLAKLSNELKL